MQLNQSPGEQMARKYLSHSEQMGTEKKINTMLGVLFSS